MSNDLISRHEVTDTLEGVDWYHINDKGEMVQGSSSEHESWYRHDDIFKAIEAIPSAEPVHGEWVQISPARIYECSKCGQNVMTDDIESYKFCHGCGAKMGGEKR